MYACTYAAVYIRVKSTYYFMEVGGIEFTHACTHTQACMHAHVHTQRVLYTYRDTDLYNM